MAARKKSTLVLVPDTPKKPYEKPVVQEAT